MSAHGRRHLFALAPLFWNAASSAEARPLITTKAWFGPGAHQRRWYGPGYRRLSQRLKRACPTRTIKLPTRAQAGVGFFFLKRRANCWRRRSSTTISAATILKPRHAGSASLPILRGYFRAEQAVGIPSSATPAPLRPSPVGLILRTRHQFAVRASPADLAILPPEEAWPLMGTLLPRGRRRTNAGVRRMRKTSGIVAVRPLSPSPAPRAGEDRS